MMYQSTPTTAAMTTVDPMTAVSTHRGTARSYARERIALGRDASEARSARSESEGGSPGIARRQSFPSAEVVVFEDSGHWPFLDDPERAAQLIVPFLRRQVATVGEGANS
jgi:hypothetical protein